MEVIPKVERLMDTSSLVDGLMEVETAELKRAYEMSQLDKSKASVYDNGLDL